MNNKIETLHWEAKTNNSVQCQLCPHFCTLIPNQIGKCGVRENQNGALVSKVTNKCISTHIDPIEKKPLYHFLPGSKAYSLAAMGCNFKCDWCQNWQIAQLPSINGSIYGEEISPQTHIEVAQNANVSSIAYTYTEPTIFYEYAFEIMRLAKQANIHNLFVSNGFITPKALEDLLPFLSAANIDLKAFSNSTYQKHINGRLEPVLETMQFLKQADVWIEITTLIIPTINDSKQELEQMAAFIHDKLGADTPWHISRFYPYHRTKHLSPTPLSTMDKAKEIGKKVGLQHVYQGNISSKASNTYCHSCGQLLITRSGYHTKIVQPLENDQCPVCQEKINGIWR